eukprot:7118536-Prymnesium_polylepis.1
MSQELRPGRSLRARKAVRHARARARLRAREQWATEAREKPAGGVGHMEAWVKPPTCSWDKCD